MAAMEQNEMSEQEGVNPVGLPNNTTADVRNVALPDVASNDGLADLKDADISVVGATTAMDVAEPVVEIDIAEAKSALEAALLAASEPMPIGELKRLFVGQLSVDIIRNLLDELKVDWQGRSVELATVASGYRFRVKPEYQKYLARLSNDKPLKYSRAVLETLAIIAYRQPVTRGDIEDIRGVAVSPHILKTLEERGWIDEVGHRETVGHPALFATTGHFLDDLNLRALDELPPLHELQATLDMTQFGALLQSAETGRTMPFQLSLDDNAPKEVVAPIGMGITDKSINAATQSVVEVEIPHHSESEGRPI